ncbi:hypothetical protein LBMAG56_44000 [Verrucomicrobiota bacterium]|nr:hypothetical protein LBMAG56_44000 [Verrucomicrobiota bacterium]
MIFRRLIALLAVFAAVPRLDAADAAVDLPGLLQAAEKWAYGNLDPRVLKVLEQVDQQRVRRLFAELQQRFHGDYVVDLAALKQTANTLQPLLELHPETRPYAVWLKTRLDYFEIADQLRVSIPPVKPPPAQPPAPRPPGQTARPPTPLPVPAPAPLPNPPPEIERRVWRQALSKRPVPHGAAALVPRLKAAFVAERVPPELVWLAEVESSFDPTARSPAGAAGLFQIMPATAHDLGLKLLPFDQRLDPDKSAHASARYLRHLYAKFRNWHLVVAAYNCGEGTIQRSLERHHAKAFDRISAHLPAETQLYVPKVEATILRREGVNLSQLRSPRR